MSDGDLETPAGVETLATGRFLRLVRRGRWEYAERTNSPGAVLIVAVTPEDELVLVEQYRVPLGAHCIELPAGIAGDGPQFEGESYVTAARRELLEETGYEATSLKRVAVAAANPGMDNEILNFFVARGLRRTGLGGGDGTESIVVHRIPRSDIHDWLDARRSEGVMVSQNVYAGLHFAERAGVGGSRHG